MKRKLKTSDVEEERNDPDSGSEGGSDLGSDSDQPEDDDATPTDHHGSSKTRDQRFFKGGLGIEEEPVSKMAKLSKGELYKPPTNEEIHQLKETENLFHSSLFRMQISELMSEVCLKAKRRRDVDMAVSMVTAILKGMNEGSKYELQDLSWLEDMGIQCPFVFAPLKTKGSFHFIPATEVKVTGSFETGTCIKPHPVIDLLVVMPKGCFEARDYLNQRYLRKRALYLCNIASELKNHSHVEDVKFTHHHGNHLKPVLSVSVKVGEQRNVKLHLQAVPEPGVFKLNRFHVQKNNVREHWFKGQEEIEGGQDIGIPTPFYNSCVLEDLTHASTKEMLATILSSSQGVKEGIVLLKIWLRQRGLHIGFGGFTEFIMTMYVCYLLANKKLNNFMSSFQILRNTLLNLSKCDWTETDISLCRTRPDADDNMPTVEDFKQHFDVVFVDVSGYYNICYSMNKTMFHRVRAEAGVAVALLEDKHIDSFDKLFMKKISFTSKFDHLFHFSVTSEELELVIEKLDLEKKVIDYGCSSKYLCIPALVSLLERALGQRIKLLQVMTEEPIEWNVEDDPPSLIEEKMTFGLLLNSEFAFNVLDRGPSADNPEAEEFRRFWGNKSDLRRFQDGSICEAILWLENANIAQKQLVCKQIVQYILTRHAGIDVGRIHYIGGQLDDMLQLPVSHQPNQLAYGNGQEQNVNIIRSYDDLCKMLRKLTDLPLTINSVQGTSPCFRYTEVFPPMPCNFRHRENANLTHGVKRYVPATDKHCPHYVHSMKVICTLEGSGKWPDDLEAMKRLKAAFHIQLAEAIQSNFNLPVKVNVGYVDVLKDHYVFRLVLAYNREIALLKSSKAADGKLIKRDTEEAVALEKENIVLPRLTSTLHGLQQQHPSFSTTARLAKRWISAHMLGDYIDPVAVELLVASLYLHPEPSQPPSTGLCGFHRFLELLSSFDWKTTPLLVNLNNEFTDSDYVEIPTRFSKERSTLPLMFISTPLDKYRSHWTKQMPSAAILTRLVLIAIRSLETMQQLVHKENNPDLKQIFRPSLSMYDVLIHLKPEQLPRQHEALDLPTDLKPLAYGKYVDDKRFPVLDFDPARLLLKELITTFGDVALFFHDQHGGRVIGVLWKPQALIPSDFKVSHINYSKLHTQDTESKTDIQLVPNIDAIIEDMTVLGTGVISKIEILKTPSFTTLK